VNTDRGPVAGTQANDVWAFLGVPFAAPPEGALRWAAPEAHACWTAPLAANQFGAACIQVASTNPTTLTGSEDCLTLNVWVPAAATAASKLPVLFFIHGGGNVSGSTDEKRNGIYIYDGDKLAAAENAIVVTANYRLGPMGFLAHPSFGAHAGNYGTLDQIAALSWVQRNIAAFGGDPSHVLLFGQSAGAVDVCSLVTSPLAAGLFSSALMESGGCTALTTTAAQTFAQTFADAAGCGAAADPATCLRALSASAIVETLPETASVVGPQGNYQPSVDGATLLDVPSKVIASGTVDHVPLIVGSNTDETAEELAETYPMGMTEAQYEAAVLALAGGDQSLSSQVLALYPSSDYPAPLTAFVAVTTDSKFVCTARYVACTTANAQNTPVKRYVFSHHLENATAAVEALGAWHGLELAFLFESLPDPSAGETALTASIQGYWARFAATGDPNGGGAVQWPAYDPATDPYVDLDDTVTTGVGVRTKYCDFWDGVAKRSCP
jgi:para-nitrobenzyl esterase